MTVADDACALVARTCAEQGLPVTVTDPQTLARVAAIVQAARRDEGAHPGASVIPFTFTTSTTNPTAEKGGCRGPA